MIFINTCPDYLDREHVAFNPAYIPIGIGYLIEILKINGITSHCIDQQIDSNVLKSIRKLTPQLSSPYIFGFSVMTGAYKNAINLSLKIKSIYPDSVIIFGGIHPTALPQEVLENKHIDIVVRGEGENIITELYNCVKNKRSFNHIDNISYVKNGGVFHNKQVLINDINELPIFPYSLFKSKKYDLGFTMSSRGCPYDCVFCSSKIMNHGRLRCRSTEIIIQELTNLYSQHNLKHVFFIDENFLANHKRVIELVEAIKNSEFYNKMFFSFLARGDNISDDILKLLYGAGFRTVFIGIETASERLMKIINKGETTKQVLDAIELAKNNGFLVATTFIFGLPEETKADRMISINLIKTINVDFIKINNAVPYPGTNLFNIAKKEKSLFVKGMYENFYSMSILLQNPFKKNNFPYLPVQNSEICIRRDIFKAYSAFYLNPKRFKNHFSKVSVFTSLGYSFAYIFYVAPKIIITMLIVLVNIFGFFIKYIFHKPSKCTI